MEKCTYCIQRIEQAKIARKVAAGPSGDVLVRDGEIRTACQQACPAEAIVFGNIKDAGSEVSRLKALDRTYLVLEFLATKPRTSYLARVRNPNPQMPDAQQQPLTTQMYLEKNPPHHGPHGADTHGAGAGDGKGGH
jgi:molybdopterin-containing oxidoreductase family iron-sulfur binding subunit